MPWLLYPHTLQDVYYKQMVYPQLARDAMPINLCNSLSHVNIICTGNQCSQLNLCEDCNVLLYKFFIIVAELIGYIKEY